METAEQGTAVIGAIEATLKPLMPLFRNFGVSHQDLAHMLARLFVYDTEEILKRESRPTTSARLALMTGLTRGETDRYLNDRTAEMKRSADKLSALGAPGNVLTIWNSDSRFSTPYGLALDLELKPSTRRRTFLDLVEVAAPGADAESVLDLLVAAGCVEVHEEGFVRCTRRAYIPAEVGADRITRMGTALSGLARTLTYNLLEATSEEDGLIERTVTADFPVSAAGRRAIRKWIAVDGDQFLQTLDAWIASSRQEFEAEDGKNVGIELFMFEKPTEQPAMS